MKNCKNNEKPNFSKARIRMVEREFNELKRKSPKSKIKKIRRTIYKIKNKINLFALGIEEIQKKNLDELEKNLSSLKER